MKVYSFKTTIDNKVIVIAQVFMLSPLEQNILDSSSSFQKEEKISTIVVTMTTTKIFQRYPLRHVVNLLSPIDISTHVNYSAKATHQDSFIKCSYSPIFTSLIYQQHQ